MRICQLAIVALCLVSGHAFSQEGILSKIEKIQANNAAIESRLDSLDATAKKIEERLSRIEAALDAMAKPALQTTVSAQAPTAPTYYAAPVFSGFTADGGACVGGSCSTGIGGGRGFFRRR